MDYVDGDNGFQNQVGIRNNYIDFHVEKGFEIPLPEHKLWTEMDQTPLDLWHAIYAV